MTNSVKKSGNSNIDLDSGVRSIKLIVKQKRTAGKQLTAVEKHLALNVDNLKRGMFAPSLGETILSVTQALMVPLIIGAIVMGLFFFKESINIDLSMDTETGFFSAKIVQAKKNQDKELVNFLVGIIANYQPSYAGGKEIAEAIVEISNQENIDPFYVASIVSVESSFLPHAKSPVGALGLMQLIPSTAHEVSRRTTGKKTYPLLTDPKTNVRLGIHYIRAMEEKFGGNRLLALAAYNWGPGNVKRALDSERDIPLTVDSYANKVLERTLQWQNAYN